MVPRRMAVCVVDAFKVIQIHNGQTGDLCRGDDSIAGFLQRLADRSPIEDSGEGILTCQATELGLRGQQSVLQVDDPLAGSDTLPQFFGFHRFT